MRLTALLFYLSLATAAGCGIKPGNVEAPPGVEPDSFPRTYPDPATDPQPQRHVRP
jgi:hypothetical protein